MYSSFYDKALSELFCSTFSNKYVQILNEDMAVKKLLKLTEHEYYDVKKELYDGEEFGKGAPDMEMESAYTKDGKYLGDSKTAKMLVDKFGIKQFEFAGPDSNICNIGFNPDTNIWFGWSHRVIIGFDIGDMLFEENFGDDETEYKKHGKIKIEKIDQAKQAAINFAKYIS